MSQPQNNVVPFRFEQSDIRVVDRDGDPWFVASDVARALGYSNPRDAVGKHCKAAISGGVAFRDGMGREQSMTIIPERDVYRLIMRSNLKSAELFEEWVVGEVLPSIRKTGRYEALPQSLPEALRLAADLAEKNEAQKREIEDLRPSKEALERIAEADGSMTITNAAKTLQIPPRRLTQWLLGHRWIYVRAGTSEKVAYQDKINAGHLEHKIHTYVKESGEEGVSTQVRILPKGLARLAKELGQTAS